MQIELTDDEVRSLTIAVRAAKLTASMFLNNDIELYIEWLDDIQRKLERYVQSTPGTGRIGSPAEVDGNERVGDNKDTGR